VTPQGTFYGITRTCGFFMKRKFSISFLTILTAWVLISFFPRPGNPQGPKESGRDPALVSGS